MHWKLSYQFLQQWYTVHYLFLQILPHLEVGTGNQQFYYLFSVHLILNQRYHRFRRKDYPQKIFSQQQFHPEPLELFHV